MYASDDMGMLCKLDDKSIYRHYVGTYGQIEPTHQHMLIYHDNENPIFDEGEVFRADNIGCPGS